MKHSKSGAAESDEEWFTGEVVYCGLRSELAVMQYSDMIQK